uniref:Putative secreted protein n=1 Tax=Ixodes ricinus TaxID=34613 RepID=A0A147BKE7_IXORI
MLVYVFFMHVCVCACYGTYCVVVYFYGMSERYTWAFGDVSITLWMFDWMPKTSLTSVRRLNDGCSIIYLPEYEKNGKRVQTSVVML